MNRAPENIDELREMPAPASDAPYPQRAAYSAAAALVAYVDRTREDEFETMLGDLVADLLHLCDSLGVDTDAVLERGQRDHAEER